MILNEELTEKIEETKQKLWCIACSIYYMWEKKQYITRRCKRDKLQQAETFDGGKPKHTTRLYLYFCGIVEVLREVA